MKKPSIGIAILILFGMFANPAFPESSIELQSPPTSDKQENQVNPFVGTLTVTLDAPLATRIYYDINNENEFDPETAQQMDPGTAITITSTSVLRAVAQGLLGYSEVATWTYIKDQAPTVDFLSPLAGASILRGTTVSLTVSATDPDGPPPPKVTYQYNRAGGAWVSLGQGGGSGSGFKLDWAIADDFATGPVQLRAVATDSQGASDTALIPITVTAPANMPPTVSITAPVTGTTIIKGSTVTLSASASDPDGPAPLTVKYHYSQTAGTWVNIGTGTGTAFSAAWAVASTLATGPAQLRAIAADGDGAADTALIPITIAAPPNTAPTVSITAPLTGASIVQGASVTLTATASDADGPAPLTVAYAYSQASGAWTAAGAGTGTNFSRVLQIPGDFPAGAARIRAIATDGDGASDTDQVDITVTTPANVAPTVSITSPANNSTVVTPGTVTVTASPADPDGAITKVEFYRAGTAAPLHTRTAAPWTFVYEDPPVGTYTITAVAYDDGTPQLRDTSAAVTVTVVGANRPPKPRISFPANGASYPAPFTDSVRATVTDSDGNASVVKVVFKNGATIESTDITPASWAYQKNYPAGTYKFTATAEDSLGGIGVSDTVVITVVANQAPIARAGADTSILWSPVTANVVALKGGTSSDPEGTPLAYEWSAPAGVTFTGGLTATPTASFSAPGTYAISLKVTDAGALSNTDQVIVTVNSRPAITSPLTASGTAALRFGYLMTATGYPFPTLSVTTKPSWLTQKTGTDSLIGTPPASGPFSVTLVASSTSGTDTKTLNISISDSLSRPSITSALTGTAKTGVAYSYTITARGNPSPSFTTSALPAGLSLVPGGIIGGTPTVSGNFTITLTATNSRGTDTKTFQLAINSDPRITTNLPDSLVVTEKGKATFQVNATGFPAVAYEWQYGTSATGAFAKVGTNSSMYVIESTTLTSAGYYRVIVKNGAGPDVISKVSRLKVNPLPIPIRVFWQPTSIRDAVVGNKVQFMAKASGQPKLMFQWFKGNTAVTPVPKELDTLFVIEKAALADSGLYRARVTNSFTDLTKPETYAWSDTARLIVQLPKLLMPYAKPRSGGAFYPTIRIAFGNDTAGTSIYWTDNGSDPSPTNGSLFNGDSILVDTTKTFKARAYKANFRPSDIQWFHYNLTAPNTVNKPQIKPLIPNFKVSVTCTLSTSTEGATLFYTRDGSDPRTGTPLTGSIFTLDRTTTIIAVAKKDGMLTSDTLKMTYILDPISSKVLTPTITAASNDFSGTMKAALDCATDSSSIYYTMDGTSPDSSATRILYVKGTPVSLSRTTTLQVVATRKNFLNSDIVSRTFRLLPGPITATPAPDLIFPDESITIKLAAQPAGSAILYTTEGTPNTESPEFPAEGLPISATTTIYAIAVKDGVSSTVYSFSYTKKGGQLATPTPTTANNQSTFKDTTVISLYSTKGADIYYTLNGDIPTAGAAKKYASPFVIDSTVTLQAVAMLNGYTNSKILVATYTLIPERPTANTPGGSYPNPMTVRLKSGSRRATLYYTLDGDDPTPSNRLLYDSAQGIPIASNTVLKAIAVAGNTASPVLEENYVIFSAKNFVLEPGQTEFLEGGYTLRNPEDQSAIVQGRIAGAAPANLNGFEGVQYILTLSLYDTASNMGLAFPKLTFASPSADNRSMYKIDLSGNIYFISGADTVTLQQPGSYFMGIDVSPPIITLMGEAFAEKDSTRITLKIEDNIANPSFDVKRNDDPTLNLSRQTAFSGQNVTFNLKHPNGTLKPLHLQVIVSDYRKATFFPPDPATLFPLSQRMVSIKSPDNAWSIGANREFPFDFLSVPLDLEVPLTLKSLRTANPGANVEGVAWNKDKEEYLPIPETETIRPGQGYWVGSRSRISSLSLASAVTVPRTSAAFSVHLKRGWNQIANPHLEELYWPYSRTLEEAYKGFPIKGLWEYNAVEARFKEAESLKPWRGYFVYNYLGDTSVTLSPRPVTVWAMKKHGKADRTVLSMGWGESPSLRLGADFLSSDGLGREDEFSLPQLGGLSIRSFRNGASLNSDWIRLRADGIQEWKVAMEGAGDTLPALRILTQEIPDGHETWAVSLSRSMKFRLEPGREIPASGLAKDTLLIYSGHKDQLARFGLLQSMSLVAPSLDLKVSTRNGGFTMRMSLPSKARIHATVWSLQGARLGEMVLGPLSGGQYGFAYETDFRNRPARLTPAIYFLSLEVRGAGLNKRLARKIVIPN